MPKRKMGINKGFCMGSKVGMSRKKKNLGRSTRGGVFEGREKGWWMAKEM
jgi:hypothetical protein